MAQSKDSITNTNPVYNSHIDIWQKCRATYKGQQAIKDGGKKYLPIGNGMNEKEYEAYKNRAVFYNATKRTVDGLTGVIFRKDPTYEVPNTFEDTFWKLGYGGKSAIDISHELTEEVVITSRCGLLVDFPANQSEELLSKEEAEALGQRPYASIYRAENIINWKFKYTNNGVKLSMVVLMETIEDKSDNKYEVEYINQYRELYLDDDGFYAQRVYAEDGNTHIDEEYIPLINGQRIDFIPFWIATPQGNEYREIIPPVINDLSDLNIAHYVNSADREQELYWAGVKMFVFPAWEDSENPPRIGKPISAPENCKPMVLEASAGSVIQEEMTKKEERMAVLGSQILSGKGRYVESAQTAQIHQSGEQSVLASIAQSITRIMEDVLNFCYAWENGIVDYKSVDVIKFELNNDFDSTRLSGQDITSLVMGWQQKGYGSRILFNNLKDGEIIPKEMTFEEYKKDIEESNVEVDPFNIGNSLT